MVGATLWKGKDEKEEGKREFLFGCDNMLDRDDWIINLEFMRTKAVYDNYASRNIPVQFPIKISTQTSSGDHESKDLSSLLFDFGSNFKN